ncbi:hydroxylysine kinase-like [Lytechinus variegatus]|uniref:hydroxylysine kinase-like n=1 Tax=Lytechinus variegatus TaxID=7654 RepID=UPI001BB12AA8|nr:hydroxylysine kinase-like [Lytechinus variegatus]
MPTGCEALVSHSIHQANGESDSQQYDGIPEGNIQLQIKPQLSFEQACNLIAKLYGFQDVVCLKEFISYYNQNILIEARRPNHQPVSPPEKFVLKLTNSEESQLFILHQQQNEILLKLKNDGIPCCWPVQNAAGEDLSLEKLSFKHRETGDFMTGSFIVRILGYIPGQSSWDAPLLTPKICYEGGQLLGQLSTNLQNISIDKTESIRRSEDLIWCLSNVPRLREYLFVLQDNNQRRVIEDVIDAFEEKVLKIEHKLRKGMIHSDFSEFNLLVRDRSLEENFSDVTDDIKRDVVGIIDFDHMMYSCIVYDIAISIMYLMQCTNLQLDPVKSGGIRLAGFLSKRALTECEWRVLYYCVAARFAQSLVIGLHTHSLQPQNDYILSSQKKGWQVLFDFWARDAQDVYSQWRKHDQHYNQFPKEQPIDVCDIEKEEINNNENNERC